MPVVVQCNRGPLAQDAELTENLTTQDFRGSITTRSDLEVFGMALPFRTKPNVSGDRISLMQMAT